MVLQKGEAVFGVFDLFHADEAPLGSLARAATTKIKTQRHIAELVEHIAGRDDIACMTRGTKAMQNDEGGAFFVRANAVGHGDRACQRQSFGCECDVLFGHKRFALQRYMFFICSAR